MPEFDSRHDFTAEPLTSAAPQISTPRLGQVHTLYAEPTYDETAGARARTSTGSWCAPPQSRTIQAAP